MSPVAVRRLWPGGTFVHAAHTYWAGVFPLVSRELSNWSARAQEIPDRTLRAHALQALAKRGNMEGAAAFAAFVPRVQRAAVVRAIVAFQSTYNHLDTISEQSGSIQPREGRRLHEALLASLARLPVRAGQDAPPKMGATESAVDNDFHRLQGDYEHFMPVGDDDGYLAALVEACREALCELPSYAVVAPAARRAAERVVCFQAFNMSERQAIEQWGRRQTPPGSDLRWWETAASGGSSLGVHVMIAAAAEPGIDQGYVAALERAYFPWIGALHSLLDHLIDIEEDAAAGQCNLIDQYASPQEAAGRMALLAERGLASARELESESAHRHELIVAAMASFYLSSPEAWHGKAVPISRAVLDALGPLARPPLAIFKTRRAAERVYYACRAHGHNDRIAPGLALATGHR
ncbi:MAG TPA: DUF2600 family protein [Solirubrobacteraceae bacterium]|nr:DUF2600 family protein [Solirubrobacteraceae bacterium]